MMAIRRLFAFAVGYLVMVVYLLLLLGINHAILASTLGSAYG